MIVEYANESLTLPVNSINGQFYAEGGAPYCSQTQLVIDLLLLLLFSLNSDSDKDNFMLRFCFVLEDCVLMEVLGIMLARLFMGFTF